jgi:hypothetical protein
MRKIGRDSRLLDWQAVTATEHASQNHLLILILFVSLF